MISCLMVTLPTPNRIEMLKRSIRAYQAQSMRDRELVVVMNSGRATKKCCRQLSDLISTINDPSIHLIDIQGDRSLGELRNISVSQARGRTICQWDDDDISHPKRLSEQYQQLQSTDSNANILSEILLFFNNPRSIFYTNWKNTPYRGFTGSLMCRTDFIPAYPQSGDYSMLGEDSYVAQILIASGRMQLLEDKAYLFTYFAHGENSWSQEFFENIHNTLTISAGLLERKKNIILEQLQFLELGLDPILFKSSTGDVFTYLPKNQAISDTKFLT